MFLDANDRDGYEKDLLNLVYIAESIVDKDFTTLGLALLSSSAQECSITRSQIMNLGTSKASIIEYLGTFASQISNIFGKVYVS